jgi:hypothetical protein
VPASADLLLGKIAVTAGFCTAAQLEACIRLQTAMKLPTPLGQLLVNEGYLSAEQLAKIVETQRRNMDAVDPVLNKRKESTLFGKLAVREGLLTEEEANECLRRQALPGETRTIGEIMVAEGFLTPMQVRDLLGRQQKRILACPPCRLSFTVLTHAGAGAVECPRCGRALEEPKAGAPVRTDAEFSAPPVKTPRPAPAPKAPPPPAPATPALKPLPLPPDPAPSKKLRVSCIVCDTPFEGQVDSTGRLRCPGCRTAFTPR